MLLCLAFSNLKSQDICTKQVNLFISTKLLSHLGDVKYTVYISEEEPSNQECEGCEADLLGEGKESGEINTSQSLVFTTLQVMPHDSILGK